MAEPDEREFEAWFASFVKNIKVEILRTSK